MSGIVRYNRTRTSGLIKGVAGVPAVSGDKSPATAGDMWYNSSSNTLRCYIPITAWSAGGALGTARNDCMGFGTSGAAGVAGGNHPALGTTEEYNGSSWSAGGDTNTDAHGYASAGLLTAGIKACGYTTSTVAGAETYDGSSWTAIPDCTSARYESGGLGTATAFAVVAGDPGSNTVSDTTFIYNGTAWSTGGTLNTPGHYVNCTGTTTAGLRIGGLNPIASTSDVIEEYNGTDWTTVTSYPTTITHRACAGLQTDTWLLLVKQTTQPALLLMIAILMMEQIGRKQRIIHLKSI